jgi:hypothetical protein
MTSTAIKNGHIDIAALKAACAGRWREILSAIGGIPDDHLDGRHHPCPRCGGTDRFRAFDDADQTGGLICNQCHTDGGDGIASLRWALGLDFGETVKLLADHVGLRSSNGQAKKLDPLELLARDKRVSVDSLIRYGARVDGRNVVFPVYGPDGLQCSSFRLWAAAKGLFESGKPAGLFFPHTEAGDVRLPQHGETWFLVEGVKDASALEGLGYLACGLNTSLLAQKFVALFRGVHVCLIPDRDAAGEKGAKDTAARLRGVAASVRLAVLPAEYSETGGADVRDVLAKRDGEKLLRDAIDQAQRVDGDGDGEPVTIVPISIGALVAANPTLRPPIIDGLLRRGETANVIAAPKVGKSWLAYDLALATATGGEWLGRYRCEQGRVLLIDNELHPSTIATRIPAVAQALNIPEGDYCRSLDILPLRGCLLDLHGIERLLTSVETGAYSLVILDAWYRAIPAGTSENDNGGVAILYNTLDRIAGQIGCGWVNIHHASKGVQSDKSITDVGAGAGSQSRAADAHIVLRPHEDDGCIVLDAVLRSFAPVEPLGLRWEYPCWHPSDELDTSRLKRQPTAQQLRQTQADSEGKAKIIASMVGESELTSKQLRTATGMSRERLRRLLDSLVYEGRLTSTTTKKRGQECDEYRLSTPPESDSGDELPP